MKIPLITAAIILIADQASKLWMSHLLGAGENYIRIIPGFFHLEYVVNTGAAFGILQGRSWWLGLFALVVLIFLFIFRKDFFGSNPLQQLHPSPALSTNLRVDSSSAGSSAMSSTACASAESSTFSNSFSAPTSGRISISLTAPFASESVSTSSSHGKWSKTKRRQQPHNRPLSKRVNGNIIFFDRGWHRGHRWDGCKNLE